LNWPLPQSRYTACTHCSNTTSILNDYIFIFALSILVNVLLLLFVNYFDVHVLLNNVTLLFTFTDNLRCFVGLVYLAHHSWCSDICCGLCRMCWCFERKSSPAQDCMYQIISIFIYHNAYITYFTLTLTMLIILNWHMYVCI
jgi:hypothetical protein